MNNDIIILCKSVWYYSETDEELFFQWIDKIKEIIRSDGRGDEQYLYFKSSKITDDSLRELIALFYRYKVDMKQLKIFLNDNNKEWFFGIPKAYWHRRVFGTEKQPKKVK